MKSGLEILEEIGAAAKAQEKHGTVLAEDATFEEGVIAALMWVTEHPNQTSLMVEYLREYEADLYDLSKTEAVA